MAGRNNIGFPFPGSKQRLAPDIVRFLPTRGSKFIDLFAGRGNITLYAMDHGYEYDEWILNDIRKFTFLQAVKDYGDKLTVPPRSDIDPDRMAELAAQGDPEALLIEPYSTFNGAGYEAGGSRTEGGRRTPESYEAALRGAHKLLNEHNVRITSVDWYDCLLAEQPGKDCAVVADAPYLECDVYAYYPDDICPTELIAYLQSAEHPWVFCEYDQPLYLHAFGEPAYKKTVQLKTTNFAQTGGKEQRVECIWTNTGTSLPKRDMSRLVPVPKDRKDTYYVGLSLKDLLQEIKECATVITAARNRMNKEMRKRLMPAIIALWKRTYRKHPGFYKVLATIGLNPDTVRQWFYRSRTADEVIDLLEENKQEEPKRRKAKHTPLTALQTEVIAALIDQGCKQKEAVSLLEAATGDDFTSLFKSALAQRSGLTVPEPVSATTTTAPVPPEINVVAAELIRDIESVSRKEKLSAVVESRSRLNPTVRNNLISALKNAARDAAAFEKQLSKEFQEFPADGKAHQRVVRERMAEQPGADIAEKRRLAADFKNAVVREISYEEARNLIVANEWLGNMGTTEFSFGLFFGTHLAGTVCFGRTAGTHVAASICGFEHRHKVATLCRGACCFWADHEVVSKGKVHSGAAASYLIARACKLMTKKGYHIFVAYSDPNANEIGTIYQAANWLYCGMTNPAEKYKTPDGKIHDSRQIQCLTRDRRGGTLKYKRTRSQQKQLMIEEGCEFFEGHAKHRYVGLYGDRRTKRILRRALQWESLPYPKRQPSATIEVPQPQQTQRSVYLERGVEPTALNPDVGVREIRTMPPVLTSTKGNSADVMADIATIHFPRKAKIIDLTFGKGVFWRKLPDADVTKCDILPLPGVEHVLDATKELPFKREFNIATIDPPYLRGAGDEGVIHKNLNACYQNNTTVNTYYKGGNARSRMMRVYFAMMQRASRVVKKGGLIIVKGMDDKQSWFQREVTIPTTLKLISIHVLTTVAQPMMRHNFQLHARKNHSYFLVLKVIDDSPPVDADTIQRRREQRRRRLSPEPQSKQKQQRDCPPHCRRRAPPSKDSKIGAHTEAWSGRIVPVAKGVTKRIPL